MAKQPRVWSGSQWEPLAVTLPDLSNYSTTTQMNTAIDNAKGLVLITTATIGSSVSSVTVNNCFSSTYDNYKITVTGGSMTASNQISLRLGSATTDYLTTFVYNLWNVNSLNVDSSNTQPFFAQAGSGTPDGINFNVELTSPFLTKRTTISGPYIHNNVSGLFWGYHNANTSFTSFTLIPQSGQTLTGGTVRVYGYRNS